MNYDVIILGTGISGSILAAITARHGLSTLLIDHGHHPRFTVGESMIPGTSHLLRIMAERYDVPELEYVSTFRSLRRHVTSSSGMKRNFSFVHHTTGARLDPTKSTMLPIPHYPNGPESHLMRQDVDAFLFAVAVRYGADALQDTSVVDFEKHEQGWTLKTKCGRTLHGKYIVDGSGHNSVLAKRYGWREPRTRLDSHSRSIFTHMVGVRPFDDFFGPQTHRLPQPLSQGTLHHIFDGGWLWVIPFDNHESAGNPLCSVGLQLDPRRFPPDPEGPEAEFRKFLAKYPDMAVQFEHARAVRAWVSAPRLQYSSTTVVGDRCCLAPHSAGFVDPLFSRGLHITMESINALAHRLIDAVRLDDFSSERFQPLEKLTQTLIESHDKLTNGSFIAFRDFELWNAWYRVWVLGGFYSTLRFQRAHVQFRRTKDRRFLDNLENHEHFGTPSPEMDEYQTLFRSAYAIMLDVEAARISIPVAISKLYALYRGKPWIPPGYGLDDRSRRYATSGDLKSLVLSTYWGYRHAPTEVRRRYFDFPPTELVKSVLKELVDEKLGVRRLRDAAHYARFDRYRSAQSPEYPLPAHARVPASDAPASGTQPVVDIQISHKSRTNDVLNGSRTAEAVAK
ncbi:NAD(P)/FAD-dependent oxidoreductase [Pendulispora brunnea]|uniref:NAD(P)/FAD-dependent oxidoreductase n=1 Tax=Pendulispora brunnea TaxID=2905690 RepID=A0ABZ2KJK6_9BACT